MQSEPLKGSTFTIYFKVQRVEEPIDDRLSSSMTQASIIESPTHNDRLRILITEDNVSSFGLAARCLLRL